MNGELAEWIERQLADAPPLSDATKDKIAALLSSRVESTAA
jgi:hypothetical protein